MSKINENVLKVLIANYQSQTSDNEEQIRNNIKRFQQLGDALVKKIQDGNPLVFKLIPKELIETNQFKDVTKYIQYDHLLLLIQTISSKPVDPYKQAIEYFKKVNPYMDPKIIGNYVARFKINLDELIRKVELNNKSTLSMIPKEILTKNQYTN